MIKDKVGFFPYLFLFPAMMMFGLFVIVPFFGTFVLSMTSWDGMAARIDFIGAANYAQAFGDSRLHSALLRTLIWILVVPTFSIGLGFAIALILWYRPAGFHFYRTLFFIPQVLGPAIVGVIWLTMMQPVRGAVPQLGEALGLEFLQYSVLGDATLALFGVMWAEIWMAFGFFIIVFMTGLQSVDWQLDDAARIDGAGLLARIRHVIIPQLAPVFTLAIILSLIASLNVFDIIFAMTGGGPANSTELIGLYAYERAFRFTDVGYASALTVIIVVLAIMLSSVTYWFRGVR